MREEEHTHDVCGAVGVGPNGVGRLWQVAHGGGLDGRPVAVDITPGATVAVAQQVGLDTDDGAVPFVLGVDVIG